MGFFGLDDPAKMAQFGLNTVDSHAPLFAGIVGGLNRLNLLKAKHANRKIEDHRFLSSKIATWTAWIEAVEEALGSDPIIKTNKIDTEPDEFYFNFGNYSGKFSFNLDGSIVMFPNYDGMSIDHEIQTVAGRDHIVSFTVTTPEGMEYKFGKNINEAIDFTRDTSYYLPNIYTYPEENIRTRFKKAQLDVAFMEYNPFFGPKHLISYGNSYDRNYKIMSNPSFVSGWHLVSVKSLLSEEEVNLSYSKRDLNYYANKSFNHTLPNFNKSGEYLATTPNQELNLERDFLKTKWENGRAEFAYSATQTRLTRSHLTSIKTSRDETVNFIYEKPRGEIVGDFLCSRIEVHRNCGLYTGWQLNYTEQDVVLSSSDCFDTPLTSPMPPAISIKDEFKFDLKKRYEYKWFEYNDYFFFNFRIGCFTLPFRFPFPFNPEDLGLIHDFGYRTHLSEFGSLMEVKALNNRFDPSLEDAIFNAEKKRTFLQSIEELGKDGTAYPFVTEINYIGGGQGIPKRFDVNQDLFGYQNDNSLSGSPLPRLSYTSLDGSFLSMDTNAEVLSKHFGFENVDAPGNMHEGQNVANPELATIGAIQGLTFASGGSISYSYEPNVLPSGVAGAGLRITSLVENPGDSPAKTTKYSYETPSVINDPIRISQNKFNYFYRGLESRVVTTSAPQNLVYTNKNNHVGYNKVTETWNGYGSRVHYFTTPDYFDPIDHFNTVLYPSNIGEVGVFKEKRYSVVCGNVVDFPSVCTDFSSTSTSTYGNLPPSLEITDGIAYRHWMLGVEYQSETYTNGGENQGILRQKVINNYQHCQGKFGVQDGNSLRYFKSEMFQNNYPGSYWENFIYREISNFLVYGLGQLGELISYFTDLLAGLFTKHPFKEIDRYYFTKDCRLTSGNIRLIDTKTINYFTPSEEDGAILFCDAVSNNSTTSYEYVTECEFANSSDYPYVFTPKTITTTNSDGTSTTSVNYFIFEDDLPPVAGIDNTTVDIIGLFGSPAGNPNTNARVFLNDINYLQPVASITYLGGEITNASVTALARVNGKIVPASNWGARNGVLALNGKFNSWNSDGKPTEYQLAHHGATLNGNNSLYFSPIKLGWNNRLQLLERTYIDFTTKNKYNCHHELELTIDPANIESTYKYDNRGRLEVNTTFNGKQTKKYTYSIGPSENTITTELSFADGLAASQITTQKMDGYGKALSLTRDNDGAELSSTIYDGFWRAVGSSTLQNGPVTMDIEASPIPTWNSATDAVGNTTTTWTCAGGANAFTSTFTTDPNGHTSQTDTDGLGRTLKTISPEQSITQYSYDGLGRVQTITNPIGEQYIYTYNDIGTIATKKIPGMLSPYKFWWDVGFRPAASQDPNGDIQLFEHDQYNRLTKVLLSSSTSIGADINTPVAMDVSLGGTAAELLVNSYDGTYLNGIKEAIFSGQNGGNVSGSRNISHLRDGVGRITFSQIMQPAGTTKTTFKVNDAFLTYKSTSSTNAGSGLSYSYDFSFDDVLRPEDTNLTVDGESRLITSLEYNNKDLVATKFLGEVSAGSNNFLQKIDYLYDAAGRLTNINTPTDMECYSDEEICSMKGVVSYESNVASSPPVCQFVDQITIDGQVYQLPNPIDLLGTPVLLGQAVADALDYLGYFGSVTQYDNQTDVGVSFTIVVTETNASSITIGIDNCPKGVELEITECCAEPTPQNIPGGSIPFSNNDDLFFSELTYDGIDIVRVDMASDCTVGGMRNDYTYDGNHRVRTQKNAVFLPERIDGRYDARYEYDLAGNISLLNRRGLYKNDNDDIFYNTIDQLAYTYLPGSSRLQNVTDNTSNAIAQPFGFTPESSSYEYDSNGNIIFDSGKDLTIDYNLINLPHTVTGADGVLYLDHTYSNTKVKKIAPNGDVREYVNGVEVAPNDGDSSIESYHFGDGRVTFEDGKVLFQYKITDHLGNTMVLFSDKDDNGAIDTELTADDPEDVEVLQRNHYYPFGLPMQGEWQNQTTPRMDYLYNGKENEEELGLNWQAFGFRYYDNAIGRFVGVDPIAGQFAWVSGYNYAENEPIGHIDLWGLQGVAFGQLNIGVPGSSEQFMKENPEVAIAIIAAPVAVALAPEMVGGLALEKSFTTVAINATADAAIQTTVNLANGEDVVENFDVMGTLSSGLSNVIVSQTIDGFIDIKPLKEETSEKLEFKSVEEALPQVVLGSTTGRGTGRLTDVVKAEVGSNAGKATNFFSELWNNAQKAVLDNINDNEQEDE